jgi:hypothetical protein
MAAIEVEPILYVFFGLIATGKSVLARAWADRCHCPYYNSDILRKELAGLEPSARRTEAMTQGIYSSAFSRKTYDTLLERAAADLAAGHREVVLDASYQSRAERDRLREMAVRLGCRLLFILCTCPEEEIRRRLVLRGADPTAVSDGRWEIYSQQRQRFEPPDECGPGEWFALVSVGPVAELLQQLAEKVAQSRGVN